MATNSGLKIKLSDTTLKGWGNKTATQPIMLELQLETSTPLDMMIEMILDGFKVKRNDRANYHPELMVGFPPRLLDITGKHVVGDLSLQSNENVIVHVYVIGKHHFDQREKQRRSPSLPLRMHSRPKTQ